MSQIAEQLADPTGWLVLAGGGLQACAHLFKNQLVLRLVLLAGTMHYIAYYFVASEQPLWPAIIASAALTVGALIGLLRMFVSPPRAGYDGEAAHYAGAPVATQPPSETAADAAADSSGVLHIRPNH